MLIPMLYKLYTKLYILIGSEEGQNLVEYALVVALIAFSATAGMKTPSRWTSKGVSGDQHHARKLYKLILDQQRRFQPLPDFSGCT